jgi:diguanylate cyclase (GGDEF)-like protein/PAS domain S-box-containing protein
MASRRAAPAALDGVMPGRGRARSMASPRVAPGALNGAYERRRENVKLACDPADKKPMSTAATRKLLEGLDGGEVALSALRALPGTAVLVFDRELRYVLAGGGGLAPGDAACAEPGVAGTSHTGVAAARGPSGPAPSRPAPTRLSGAPNQPAAELGPSAAELEGRPAVEVHVGERWATYEPLYRAALRGESRSVEVWSADESRCEQIEVAALRDPDGGEVLGGLAVLSDVTARKHAEEARRHAQERFELIFEHAPIGMALITPDGRWVRINQALLAITGYTAEELLAKSPEEITHPDDLASDIEHARALLAGEIRDYQLERRYLHARGHVISTLLSVSLVRDRQGRALHLIAQIQDVTERKLIDERLRELAEHDPLTGLHNRRALERALAIALARCRRAGERAALLILDLDDFARVNHTCGPRAGDDLLKAIAAELTRRLRGTDLVARLGGDEFAVLLPGTDGPAARTVAANLCGAIADCAIQFDGQRLSVGASAGVAAIDAQTPSAEAALVEADRAMYAAKGRRAGGAPG